MFILENQSECFSHFPLNLAQCLERGHSVDFHSPPADGGVLFCNANSNNNFTSNTHTHLLNIHTYAGNLQSPWLCFGFGYLVAVSQMAV